MKPVRLAMQAFGPFAGREQVNFSELPTDALFLIHGPTGAGKTTLLDGICYALYGSTSGGERQAREMRSQHAPDSMQTEVELEFELGGQRFLVKRIPEQERASLRGKKDKVRVAASAELYRHDDNGWASLASKSGEVNASMEQLLGFEADQFRQVIMLPQGQFRKLLSSTTSEREKIMETLFSTEKYRRLQDRLQESARSLERQTEEEERKRETLLGQAELENEQALRERIAVLSLALEDLQPALMQARSAAAAAADAVLAGELLGGKFAELEQSNHALQRMRQNDEDMTEQRQRLAMAQVARQVEPSWEMLHAAMKQHEEASRKAEAATADAAAAATIFAETDARLKAEAERESEREGARRRLTLLEGQRDSVARLEDAKKMLEQAAVNLDTAKKLLELREREAAGLAARKQELKAETEHLMPLASRAETARLEADKQENLLRMAVNVENTRLALDNANASYIASARKLEAAQMAVTAARRKRDQLHETWRLGQAAVLARHLHDGEDCPVCGSRDHPRPARQDTGLPADEALNAAADELEAAEAACDKLRISHSAVELTRGQHAAELNTLRSTLAAHEEYEAASIAERRSMLAALREEAKKASGAAARLEQTDKQLKECEAAVETNNGALEETRTAASRAQAASQAAVAGYDALAGSIPQAMRSRAALEEAIRKAGAEVQAFDMSFKSAQQAFDAAATAKAAAAARSQGATEALAGSAERRNDAQRALDDALGRAGFADAGAFVAARMDANAMAAAERRIKEHDELLAAARERLARAEDAVRGQQAPDLAALREASLKANAAMEEVLGRQGVLLQQQRDLGRTDELLAEVRARLDAIEQEYRILGELAAVAAGKNGANMAFQRYVLAALLDDVLRQASLRLKTMSRNRYALQRSGGVTDGRRAAGLDLEVLDDYTGRTRPASTLSGGEGFMASLALALGLSDTVQAYAGGVRLDTLFIDEGFGTLDPEALDLAMKTLIDLQQKGRMVGIISHVEELKRQIDNGIEVRFAASGSTVRIGSAARKES